MTADFFILTKNEWQKWNEQDIYIVFEKVAKLS